MMACGRVWHGRRAGNGHAVRWLGSTMNTALWLEIRQWPLLLPTGLISIWSMASQGPTSTMLHKPVWFIQGVIYFTLVPLLAWPLPLNTISLPPSLDPRGGKMISISLAVLVVNMTLKYVVELEGPSHVWNEMMKRSWGYNGGGGGGRLWCAAWVCVRVRLKWSSHTRLRPLLLRGQEGSKNSAQHP